MKLENIIQGKHNKESFRFEKGFLFCFDRKWDKSDIQTLVEIANLLHLQGYQLKKPVSIKTERIRSMFGDSYTVNKKEYEEVEDNKVEEDNEGE